MQHEGNLHFFLISDSIYGLHIRHFFKQKDLLYAKKSNFDHCLSVMCCGQETIVFLCWRPSMPSADRRARAHAQRGGLQSLPNIWLWVAAKTNSFSQVAINSRYITGI